MTEDSTWDAVLFRRHPGVGPSQALRRYSVDQRFNRSRFDAQVMLDALSRRLSDEVDLVQLDRELRQVAQHTMQPATMSVWVR